jgi:bifunctional non-homologous end joining protein LigD
MLARSGRGVPVDLAEWAIEPKWDGWRCLARVEGESLRLTSRWRNDLTAMFPDLCVVPDQLRSRRLLLDGEIVALRADGSQDFHALNAHAPRGGRLLAFACFDVLYVEGADLLDESYAARRHELEQLRIKDDRWFTTPSARGDAAAALYAYTRTHGWEGVVAKRLESPYRPAGRDGAWLKAKHPHARDLHVDRSKWSHRARVDGALVVR